ncbi:Hypothetical predicted protein, partial [Pelobates cultripes]
QLTELPTIILMAHQGLQPPGGQPLLTVHVCEGEQDVSRSMQLHAAPHRGRTQKRDMSVEHWYRLSEGPRAGGVPHPDCTVKLKR